MSHLAGACHSLWTQSTLLLYTVYTVPAPCRANILLGNWTQPIWGNCTLQTLLSLLFLAWESDQSLQTAVMAFRERLIHARDSHASFESLAGIGACVCRARWLSFCLCIFFVFRSKYLLYRETEQKKLFVFTVSTPRWFSLFMCFEFYLIIQIC